MSLARPAASHAALAAEPLLLIARSDNFAHMDEIVTAAADAHGLRRLAQVPWRAAGVLDAVSETYLTPCAEDGVTLFFFGRGAAAESHPALAMLLSSSELPGGSLHPCLHHPSKPFTFDDVGEDGGGSFSQRARNR